MTGCCRKPIRGRTSHSPPRGSAFSSRLRTRVISSPAALRSPPPMSAGLPPSSSSASRTSISRRSRKFCSRLPRTWVRRDATANSDFGLVDPYRALDALADKVAADHPTAAAATSAATAVSETFRVSQLAPGDAAIPAPRSTQPEGDDVRASVEKKRLVCRQEGASKGMRGPDLQDYVVICVAEARLACLK